MSTGQDRPVVLFAGQADRWPVYRPALSEAFAALELDVTLTDTAAPQDVEYIVYAPSGPVQDFSAFPNLVAVFSLWAGVEKIVANPTLTVPLTRMVDDGLRAGMVEWVAGHVLRHHLGMDAHIANPGGVWDEVIPPLAADRRVGILGLGALGMAVAECLQGLGFRVSGWSRRIKADAPFPARAGAAGLAATLADSEILVLLLPDTPETQSLIDADRLAMLPKGAVILNPGRGTLIDDAALIAALDAGHLGHATLDVFRTEPLPADHPFWAHPGVTVTPHIAAATRPESASRAIAENLRRALGAEPLLNLVDPKAGY